MESTYHRQVRAAMQELQSIAQTWDELVLHDGLRASKTLVDSRTELECVHFFVCSFRVSMRVRNALALVPGRKPKTHLVSEKISVMEKCIVDLDVILSKLVSRRSVTPSIMYLTRLAEETIPEDERHY